VIEEIGKEEIEQSALYEELEALKSRRMAVGEERYQYITLCESLQGQDH
jgi:hypothetical protein